MNNIDDILIGVKQGDYDSFNRLFICYYARLCAYIAGITHDDFASEDIVQELFVKLWVNRAKIEIKENITAYLFKSSKNAALNYLRSERNKNNVMERIPVDTSGSDEDDLEHDEFLSSLEKCINQLPARSREVFLLHRFERLKQKEIAEKLNISVQTIKNQIWNPEDGSIAKSALFRYENGQTRIPVSFKPYESKLFVFKAGKPAGFVTTIKGEGKQIFPSNKSTENIPLVSFENGGYAVNPVKTGEYTFVSNSKKSFSGHFVQDKEVVISNFKGSIHFEAPYKDNIPDIEIAGIQPLTESANPDIRYFSGNAHYTLRFKIPEGFETMNEKILLDIGEFGSVAHVSLNGKQFGNLWKSGIRLDITGLLKKTGENELKVTVANVYRNRLIGDLEQYGKVQNLWTSAPIEQLLKKDIPLQPSGLLGPLKLFKNKQQVFSIR